MRLGNKSVTITGKGLIVAGGHIKTLPFLKWSMLKPCSNFVKKSNYYPFIGVELGHFGRLENSMDFMIHTAYCRDVRVVWNVSNMFVTRLKATVALTG